MYKAILSHTYRATDGYPDNEGINGTIALSALLYEMESEHKRMGIPYEPPIIVFGADLREMADGIPLHKIYSDHFLDVSHTFRLEEGRSFKVFTPDMIGESPVGTRTELELFEKVRIMFHIENENALILSREPHQRRIIHLQNSLNSNCKPPHYETNENILSRYFFNPEVHFDDYLSLSRSENLKLRFMDRFDKEGRFIEWFSKVSPRIKRHVLRLIDSRR